jgi:hypothetical protein
MLKLSIAIFLMRLASTPWIVWTIRVVAVIVILSSLMLFFSLIFECRPVSYIWLQFNLEGGGTCIDPVVIEEISYTFSSLSAVTDWTLAVLPAIMVKPLQMHTRKKISVIFLLSLGAL